MPTSPVILGGAHDQAKYLLTARGCSRLVCRSFGMLSFPLQLLVCASLVCGSWSRGGIEAQPPQRDITLFVGSRTPFTPSLVLGTPSGVCAL